MCFKYLLLFVAILFLNSCYKYIGDYKEIYFYKYSNLNKSGYYSLVFNDSIDSYSNFKYLQIAEKIKDNLELLGFVESKDVTKSNYLVYYDYSITSKNNIYNAVLSIKIFDKNRNINVFNEKTENVSKKYKVIFDGSSVLYTSNYLPRQDINCLVNAILKTQIISKNKTISIKSKFSKEEENLNTAEGIYYCIS